MDLNTDALQNFAVGASGGLPVMLFFANSLRGLRDSFDTLSSRLLKLEVLFEATYKEKVEKLAEKVTNLENQIKELKGE